MPDPAFKRAHRVGQLLQKELAALLVEGVRDPRVGFVTVTEVRVSDDLRNARVYVSVYGSDEERAGTLDGLRDAAGYLKREVGRRVRLKYTPNLSFSSDNSLDRATRLEALLDAADKGATEVPDVIEQEVAPVKTARSDMAERKEELDEARRAREHANANANKRGRGGRNKRRRRRK